MGFEDFRPLHPAKNKNVLQVMDSRFGIGGQQGRVVALPDGAIGDPAHGHLPQIVVVVQRRYQHLEGRRWVSVRRRYRVQHRLEEGLHVEAWLVQVGTGVSLPCRGVQHREVQLFLVRGQFQEQVLDQIDHLCNAGLGAVYLVNYHHGGDVLLQGRAQHVGSLGHGPVHGIHQQEAAVGHVHDTFDFSTEVGVAGGVDDVDPDAAVGDGGVLGQDCNAPLPFQGIGIHYQLAHLLVGLENLALLQKRVDQGGLPVVDMGYDCEVTYGVVLVFAQIFSHQVR